MPDPVVLTPPLSDDDMVRLRTGDRVLITGTMLTGRDAAHKRLVELIEKGDELPVDLKGQIIYFVGPTPARPGEAIGSAGPTTSYRMDAYSPILIEKGLKGMIGKGARSREVIDAMVNHKAVYFAAVGGAAADVLDGKDPDHHLKTPEWGEHFVNFQAARTKYFDEYFVKAADAGVRQVAYVPDAGHARLIQLAGDDNAVRAVPLTSEQEGVALLGGAWLGGEAGALLMQSSGVGNCVNMLSLMRTCRFPMLMVITMRGEWEEFNPWQVPMGQATVAALQAAGVIVHPVDRAEEVAETVEAATRLAYDGLRAVAVVVSQRITRSGERG